MKRVLVTGGRGFVGRNVLAPLSERGFDVHASSRTRFDGGGVKWHVADLLEPASIQRLVEDVRPSHLLHLAWCTAHGEYWRSVENLRWVEASIGLLRHFRYVGGQRAVIAGTCAEYDWDEHPCIERETRLAPATVYGASKDALRRVIEAYAAEAKFEVAWGRIFFLYGPHEKPQRLVPSITRALLHAQVAPATNGTQLRDFLHVRDAGSAFAAVVDSSLVGPVNIASGIGTKVADIVHAVASYVGRLDLVQLGVPPSSPAEPRSIVANVDRLANEVGWRPSLTLAEGIAETVEWWRGRA